MIKSGAIIKTKLFNKKYNKPNEYDLILKAQKGNDNAFEELINKYEDYLYKMAFIYVKNEHDALDIFQETVLNSYLNISTLKNPKYFKTWITKILINNVNMKNRHYNKFQDKEVSDYIGDISYSSLEENLDLYNAIDSLESKYRTPIILQYFYDLTISQIAEITDCNENTVKSNIRRAKNKMYSMLKEDK